MKFDREATGIGSVPFQDPDTACRIIADAFPAMPFWPQLPKRSFLESMYLQYAEGLPGLVVDERARSIHVDSAAAAAGTERAYQHYLDGDLDFFKISADRAAGLYAFLDLMRARPSSPPFIKGQTTGPISFALSLVDEHKRAVIHNKDFFEVLTKTLAMKARWQVRALKERGANVVIFIDEPYLVSAGSSYVTIPLDEAFARFDEVAAAIKDEGALAGLHCCGNTDWGALLKRNIDIINFDAYTFLKEFLLYGDDLKEFFRRGGTVAWGIVPSSDAIDRETVAALARILTEGMRHLSDRGIPQDAIRSLVTPSCGLGTLDDERARRIFRFTGELSEALRRG